MSKLQELIDRIEAREFLDVDEVLEAAIALSGKWEAKEKLSAHVSYGSYMEPRFCRYYRRGNCCSGMCHKCECYRPSKTEEMVAALKDYLNNECPPIAWYSLTPEETEYFKGVEAVQKRIGEIVRKYEEGK